MTINSNLKKCILFMGLMFVLLLAEGFMTVRSGISYSILAGLSLGSAGLSMLYWYRFDTPLMHR